MTDEEIKLNAEKYASEHASAYWKYNYNAFISGAHSRDEEIAKLRNPWISVKDRLPEKTKGVFSCEVQELEKDKIVYYKDERGYVHTGYLNANNHWRDLDRDNAVIYIVTHWMTIPETEKGE